MWNWDGALSVIVKSSRTFVWSSMHLEDADAAVYLLLGVVDTAELGEEEWHDVYFHGVEEILSFCLPLLN